MIFGGLAPIFFLAAAGEAIAQETSCAGVPCRGRTRRRSSLANRRGAPRWPRRCRQALASKKYATAAASRGNFTISSPRPRSRAVTAPGSALRHPRNRGLKRRGPRAFRRAPQGSDCRRHLGLLSLEVRPEKFLVGEAFRKAQRWPSQLMLASSINESQFPSQHDPQRPESATWLRRERESAREHQVGVLGPLCASRRYGLLNVDGGAFTGWAEWDIIRQLCSRVAWVALDDTDFKTRMMLEYARAHPAEWEVVYEETVSQELKGRLSSTTGLAREAHAASTKPPYGRRYACSGGATAPLPPQARNRAHGECGDRVGCCIMRLE